MRTLTGLIAISAITLSQSCTTILWTAIPTEVYAAYQYADASVRLDLSPNPSSVGRPSSVQYKIESKAEPGKIIVWVYAKQAFGPTPAIAGVSASVEGLQPAEYSIIDGARDKVIGSVTVKAQADGPGNAAH